MLKHALGDPKFPQILGGFALKGEIYIKYPYEEGKREIYIKYPYEALDTCGWADMEFLFRLPYPCVIACAAFLFLPAFVPVLADLLSHYN